MREFFDVGSGTITKASYGPKRVVVSLGELRIWLAKTNKALPVGNFVTWNPHQLRCEDRTFDIEGYAVGNWMHGIYYHNFITGERGGWC